LSSVQSEPGQGHFHVKYTGLWPSLQVSADGQGLVSGGDALLLTRTALATGLDAGLTATLARRGAVRDPGKAVLDLAVMVAAGCDCLADAAMLRAEPELFGLGAECDRRCPRRDPAPGLPDGRAGQRRAGPVDATGPRREADARGHGGHRTDGGAAARRGPDTRAQAVAADLLTLVAILAISGARSVKDRRRVLPGLWGGSPPSAVACGLTSAAAAAPSSLGPLAQTVIRLNDTELAAAILQSDNLGQGRVPASCAPESLGEAVPSLLWNQQLRAPTDQLAAWVVRHVHRDAVPAQMAAFFALVGLVAGGVKSGIPAAAPRRGLPSWPRP
jgi:hypothetical protein